MNEILFKAKRKDNGQWVEGLPKYLSYNRYDGMQSVDADIWEIDHKTLCQYTGLKDKNGVKIFEGDIIRYRQPYRTTQTHVGNNIPNGSYTEPMEPGIRVLEKEVIFSDAMFYVGECDDIDFYTPLIYCIRNWDLNSIKYAIECARRYEGWFDDPKEGDLNYLIKECAGLETSDQLIDYLSGVEVIGNIHDKKEVPNG